MSLTIEIPASDDDETEITQIIQQLLNDAKSRLSKSKKLKSVSKSNVLHQHDSINPLNGTPQKQMNFCQRRNKKKKKQRRKKHQRRESLTF